PVHQPDADDDVAEQLGGAGADVVEHPIEGIAAGDGPLDPIEAFEQPLSVLQLVEQGLDVGGHPDGPSDHPLLVHRSPLAVVPPHDTSIGTMRRRAHTVCRWWRGSRGGARRYGDGP
ncbi:hypothetical protein B7486_63045, partial [cyanobacterium TDX16]